MATPAIPLRIFRDNILPGLVKAAGGDEAALIKSVKLTLKQGDEEAEIPVVNEAGETVPVTEIILVGAPSEEDAVDAGIAEEVEEPVAAESLQRMVDSAIRKQLGGSGLHQRNPIRNVPQTKQRVPAQARKWGGGRLKCFTRGTDADENEFNSYAFAKWMQHVGSKGVRNADWLMRNGIISKATTMTEGSNQDGGALVPEQFVSDIISLVEEFGVFRANARVMPMTSDAGMVPRRTSGLTLNWTGEASSISASSVGTDNVELIAKKPTTLSRISSELFEDAAIAVGDLIAQEIATAFAGGEDAAGFNGDGTSTYGGIQGIMTKIPAGGKITAASGNTAFSTLDMNDFHTVTGTVPAFPGIVPKWFISKAGFADSMQRLAHAQGGVTRLETEAGSQMSFLGYEVVFTQKLNSTLTAQASTNIIAFGDLSMSSTLGDRRALSIATSDERYFDTDETAIRGTERVAINNHDLGDASNAGPTVVLATPSS